MFKMLNTMFASVIILYNIFCLCKTFNKTKSAVCFCSKWQFYSYQHCISLL